MRGKAALLIGAAGGYLLGARAGREQYDRIVAQADRLWRDPKVQDKAAQAQDLAKDAAVKTAQAAKEAARGKIGSEDGDDPAEHSHRPTPTSPTAAGAPDHPGPTR